MQASSCKVLTLCCKMAHTCLAVLKVDWTCLEDLYFRRRLQGNSSMMLMAESCMDYSLYVQYCPERLPRMLEEKAGPQLFDLRALRAHLTFQIFIAFYVKRIVHKVQGTDLTSDKLSCGPYTGRLTCCERLHVNSVTTLN